MDERIGKVLLRKDWYQGSDAYSDGDETEEALLQVVEQTPPEEYGRVIAEKRSWPFLYHLSPIRENIINWYPFQPGMRVLELGAGCGAITGALMNRGLEVTVVDLSLRRCRINATRHRDCDGLEIIVGAMDDVLPHLEQTYDVVLLIGALEYAAVFSEDPNAYERMLKDSVRLLTPEGRLLVAIENKLGLKYFAGAREDHVGRYFEGVEGYPHEDGPRTFSREEMIRLAQACGLKTRFFYPYPDYKFPIEIFSDERLPGKGSLLRNWHAFDASRMFLFDETRVYDSLIDAGLIRDFMNSFLVELRKEA